ncbi:hypothetical protein QBC47DRAFT_377652 [Echria macrotheca]|uniref:Fe2OG dioxygenase domain-containing protein n=1 Tax=Echria macrotheca TaxID=438768 RepID=A0AAJ0FD46_9PEZI|nr:hypothetical protein QBC47DRAFT_377652 [Echria macrotheca]
MTSQLVPPPEPTIDPSTPNIHQWPALGLTLFTEFITPAEETTMITAFDSSSSQQTPHTNNKKRTRISQHFGYHFDYTTFGASSSHFTPLPEYISSILPRLPIPIEHERIPDQFTVQYYPPGAGIPPHVDTHSMFGEALYSLSFGGDVPMVFRVAGRNEARKMRLPKRSLADAQDTVAGGGNACGGEKKGEESEEEEHPAWELMLPRRSLLVMTGPARYGYTHGIKARKTDVVGGKAVLRQGRYSITMRTVRRGDEIRCDCGYPGVCDARIREEMERAEGRKGDVFGDGNGDVTVGK